jgi:hypothetical protein
MSVVKCLTAVKFFIVFICIILSAGISFAQASYSDERGAESAAAREMKLDETEAAIEMGGDVEGVVMAVNPSSRSIVVQDADDGDTTYTIRVKDSTTYAGADSISDINAGDTVMADIYSVDGEHIVAESIVVEKRAYKEEAPAQIEKVLSD